MLQQESFLKSGWSLRCLVSKPCSFQPLLSLIHPPLESPKDSSPHWAGLSRGDKEEDIPLFREEKEGKKKQKKTRSRRKETAPKAYFILIDILIGKLGAT